MRELAAKINAKGVLAVAMIAAAIMLIAFMSGLTFFQDTWSFLLHRRGFSADVFLAAHNEHIVVAPVAIEKLLLALFGMESARPEQIVLIISLLVTAWLAFLYIARRLGEWPGVIAATLLLFLGSAWQVLLWPFEYSLVGSIAGGLAMLVALDRNDRKGDILATLALVVSFSFASLGLAFAFAAAVDVVLRRKERGLSRAFVFLLPVALYAAWFLGYGREAESSFRLRNFVDAPQYVLDSLAAATAALLGLGRPMTEFGNINLDWARPVVIGLLAVALLSQIRLPGLSPRSIPAGAAALAYFAMTALNAMPGREPTSNRYLHMSAVFALLLALCLLDGRRLRGRLQNRAIVAAGVIACFAAVSNLGPLADGRAWMMKQTELTRGNLAALEIARGSVADEFRLMPDAAGTGSLIDIEAEAYFSAADRYGTPAYDEDELAGAPAHARYQADVVLLHALPISHQTALDGGSATGGPGCALIQPGEPVETPIEPGTTTVAVPDGDPYSVRLRRFADPGQYPISIEPIHAGSTTSLDIPVDRSSRDWMLSVQASQPAEVCELGSD